MKTATTEEANMAKTATLNLRVKPDLKDRVTKLAKQQDRSPSYFAEQALERQVEFEEAQIQGIEMALAELDAGQGIPDSEVKAWVESWGTENELPMPEAKQAR